MSRVYRAWWPSTWTRPCAWQRCKDTLKLGELRWILLGLGMLAIGATWWWTARRSGQAPGNAELRESTAAPVHTFGPAAGEPAPSVKRSAHADTREWGVPPLETLNIR